VYLLDFQFISSTA